MKELLQKLNRVASKLEEDNKIIEAKIVNDVFVKIAYFGDFSADDIYKKEPSDLNIENNIKPTDIKRPDYKDTGNYMQQNYQITRKMKLLDLA